MLDTLILVGIGAFVGWNLPQPFWAKAFQAWAVNRWEDFKAKK
jgi:hypothetical protein